MNKQARRFTILIIFVAVIAAAFNSCTKEEETASLIKPGNCDSAAISYQQDIVEIINGSCSYSPCHIPGSGNYDFTRYEVLADRIRSGRLEERLLLPTDHPLHMPEGYTMDACKIYTLRLWIRQGFANN